MIGGQGIFSDYTYNGTNHWGIGILTVGNSLMFRISNGTSVVNDLGISSGQAMIINTWYHYTITRKANTGTKIYRNGALLVSDTNTTNPVYNSGNIRPAIGAWNYGPLFSNLVQYYMSNGSKLDALNVWNKELSASEITELYNSGNGAQYITDNFYKPTPNDALNTYNGTAQGGLTYGVGKVGTAFQFNGTNAYVQLGDVMDVGTSSWSYAMWFNASSLATYTSLFSKSIAGSSTGRVWSHFESNKLTFNFQTEGATNVYIESTSNISTNTWYHAVFILDRTDKLKLYLNGILQNGNSANNNLIPYSASNYNTNIPFRIGAYTASDSTTPLLFFNGSIDAFNVWNRVLTQSEITELYNSGNGKQYTI